MVMVCYFKGKQTAFVQSNKPQVYLIRSIALTYKLHVWLYLGHLHYKYREY